MKNPKEKKKQQDEGEAEGYFLLSLRLAQMMAPSKIKSQMEADGYKHSTDIFREICKDHPDFSTEWYRPEPHADWVTFCGQVVGTFYRNPDPVNSRLYPLHPIQDKPWWHRFYTRLSTEKVYNIYQEWRQAYRTWTMRNPEETRGTEVERNTTFSLAFGTVSEAWAAKRRTVIMDGRLKKKGYKKEHGIILNEERLRKERENEDIRD